MEASTSAPTASVAVSPVESTSKPLRPILIIKDSPFAIEKSPKIVVKSTRKTRIHTRPQLIVVHQVFVWLIILALCCVVASLYFKPIRKLIRTGKSKCSWSPKENDDG